MLTASKLVDSKVTFPAKPDEVVVEIDRLGVQFKLPREKLSGIKEFAIRWFQKRIEYIDIDALDNVSMSVRRGEIFGIVGPNGAGKSTLLKVVAQVLYPTSGRVVVTGRVAPILELGAGFHPELTGRENVFLYGALLGRTRRQIEREMESVINFSELGEFIDSPMRTYSSGMYSRLAFAVATAEYADLFLIDEVLAVGDVEFQEKCLERMKGYCSKGASIMLVSHDPGLISRVCERGILLDRGNIVEMGPIEAVLDRYLVAGSV
jgi:ABC-2 type transport system ATP-binding protein/lipopolysaccharide transport system ATP-binding protein